MAELSIVRILEEIKKSGKSKSAISLSAFGTESTLRKILDGTTKNPTIETVEKLAGVLNTSPEYLMGRTDDILKNSISPSRKTPPEYPRMHAMANDVPVRGTAAGSHLKGAFQLDGGVVDYVRRPETLISAKDIYALYVEGSSMEPQFYPGDLIYINPHKPARIGDVIVVQKKVSSDENVEATLGIYLRKTEKHIVIKKHNPTAEVQIIRDEGTIIHKVLTMNEIYGV